MHIYLIMSSRKKTFEQQPMKTIMIAIEGFISPQLCFMNKRNLNFKLSLNTVIGRNIVIFFLRSQVRGRLAGIHQLFVVVCFIVFVPYPPTPSNVLLLMSHDQAYSTRVSVKFSFYSAFHIFSIVIRIIKSFINIV